MSPMDRAVTVSRPAIWPGPTTPMKSFIIRPILHIKVIFKLLNSFFNGEQLIRKKDGIFIVAWKVDHKNDVKLTRQIIYTAVFNVYLKDKSFTSKFSAPHSSNGCTSFLQILKIREKKCFHWQKAFNSHQTANSRWLLGYEACDWRWCGVASSDLVASLLLHLVADWTKKRAFIIWTWKENILIIGSRKPLFFIYRNFEIRQCLNKKSLKTCLLYKTENLMCRY